jgi:hypothetical protein
VSVGAEVFYTTSSDFFVSKPNRRLWSRVARWCILIPKIAILGQFWRAFEWKLGIFYDHLEYFTAIWYNLWPSGIVCSHFACFSQFGMFGPRKKSGNPALVMRIFGLDFFRADFGKTKRILPGSNPRVA